MKLSDTGESRVRGYLYVLDRSMRSTVSATLAADAVREVESHIRERISESNGTPNERDALEAILARLGSPSTVARAYSLELLMEEAAVGGRFVAVVRSLFHVAASGLAGFATALLLFTGYAIGIAFCAVALLKPIFPQNVGLWTRAGFPRSFGAQFPAPAGMELAGGYWVIPLSILAGLGVLLVTHFAARRWISATRERLARLRQQHA